MIQGYDLSLSGESFDLVLSEPQEGVSYIILAAREETKRVPVPEFYERDPESTVRALEKFIAELQELVKWAKSLEEKDAKQ